jgi:hypothetical protein
MIPVMTSTKIDKSAIDLAGVEAEEKILVLWAVESLGSTAQSGLPDQNRRSAICQPESRLDFSLSVNTYLILVQGKAASAQAGSHSAFAVVEKPASILRVIR